MANLIFAPLRSLDEKVRFRNMTFESFLFAEVTFEGSFASVCSFVSCCVPFVRCFEITTFHWTPVGAISIFPICRIDRILRIYQRHLIGRWRWIRNGMKLVTSFLSKSRRRWFPKLAVHWLTQRVFIDLNLHYWIFCGNFLSSAFNFQNYSLIHSKYDLTLFSRHLRVPILLHWWPDDDYSKSIKNDSKFSTNRVLCE